MFGRKDENGKPELRAFPQTNKKNNIDLGYPYGQRKQPIIPESNKKSSDYKLLPDAENTEVVAEEVPAAPVAEEPLHIEPVFSHLEEPTPVQQEIILEAKTEEVAPPVIEIKEEVHPVLSRDIVKREEPKQGDKKMERLLTVGFETSLTGEISGCDRLVIEGSAKVTVSSVDVMEIDTPGSFQGTADVKEAHIKGKFDGDLIVSDRLVIYETGKVTGNVSYDSLEIKHGGQISGKINTLATSDGSAHKQQQQRVLEKKAKSDFGAE